jgi:hypothetical protein
MCFLAFVEAGWATGLGCRGRAILIFANFKYARQGGAFCQRFEKYIQAVSWGFVV